MTMRPNKLRAQPIVTEAGRFASTKACEVCNASFPRDRRYSQKQWGKARFCSPSCSNVAMTLEPERRFWAKVDKSAGDDKCWPWQAGTDTKGYGLFTSKVLGFHLGKAHRVAFFLTHGFLPRIAMHRCDNPPCCNPAHLSDGTVADNNRDRTEKGRSAPPLRGSDNPRASMTEAVVADLRERSKTASVAEISRSTGLGYHAIWNAIRGRTWRHV